MLSTEFLLYVALGFVAQLVDGALGMAYGLIATSALLATGTPPALASASVHAAEIVTTGIRRRFARLEQERRLETVQAAGTRGRGRWGARRLCAG